MVEELGAILLAEDRGEGGLLLEDAFKKAKTPNRLLVVTTSKDVIDYLKGQGEYGDRARWPMPSLLLLDLKPPRLDAFKVLQWMRKQPAFDRIIAVVLTDCNQSDKVDCAYELGANSFLEKPHDLDALQEICQLLVDFWLKHNVPAGLDQ